MLDQVTSKPLNNLGPIPMECDAPFPIAIGEVMGALNCRV
jgi:hypothetical protein